jgi:hypothetical protein
MNFALEEGLCGVPIPEAPQTFSMWFLDLSWERVVSQLCFVDGRAQEAFPCGTEVGCAVFIPLLQRRLPCREPTRHKDLGGGSGTGWASVKLSLADLLWLQPLVTQ